MEPCLRVIMVITLLSTILSLPIGILANDLEGNPTIAIIHEVPIITSLEQANLQWEMGTVLIPIATLKSGAWISWSKHDRPGRGPPSSETEILWDSLLQETFYAVHDPSTKFLPGEKTSYLGACDDGPLLAIKGTLSPIEKTKELSGEEGQWPPTKGIIVLNRPTAPTKTMEKTVPLDEEQILSIAMPKIVAKEANAPNAMGLGPLDPKSGTEPKIKEIHTFPLNDKETGIWVHVERQYMERSDDEADISQRESFGWAGFYYGMLRTTEKEQYEILWEHASHFGRDGQFGISYDFIDVCDVNQDGTAEVIMIGGEWEQWEYQLYELKGSRYEKVASAARQGC